MIQAGTIRTGSARTSAVAGAYWISSIRRLRKTTLPGVIATSRPTSKASAPTGFLPVASRCQSSQKLSAPRMKFMPPCFRVCAIISGLVSGKFFGETVSSAWRARNATMSSWCLVTPGTSVAALCHHCWVSRKPWERILKGHCRHASPLKSRVLGKRFDARRDIGARPIVQAVGEEPCRGRGQRRGQAPPAYPGTSKDARPNPCRPASAQAAKALRSSARWPRESAGRSR